MSQRHKKRAELPVCALSASLFLSVCLIPNTISVGNSAITVSEPASFGTRIVSALKRANEDIVKIRIITRGRKGLSQCAQAKEG